MDRPKESDWKAYKALVDGARERHLATRNTALAAMLTDPDKTPSECFWDTLQQHKTDAKVIDDCLGHHSRSRMFVSIVMMLNYGILTDDDLATFSEDLREHLQRVRHELNRA
jgi:hypothetical protein